MDISHHSFETIIHRRKQELQNKFLLLDKNADGYATEEELSEYLKQFGLSRCSVYCKDGKISFSDFVRFMTSDKPNLLQKCLNGELAIPNFKEFCHNLLEIHDQVNKISLSEGKLPSYIPELANVDINQFGISLCTIDGQIAHIGNGTRKVFTLQHCVLPLMYCLACEQLGSEHIHEFIGREPSGSAYNAFILNEDNKPHNPFMSTGGLVCASLLTPKNNSSKRFTNVYQFIQRLAGCPITGDSNDDNSQISYSQCTYLSEKEHNERNKALCYFMRSSSVKGIHSEDNINDVLDFYVQCNSISCTTRELSIIAGTLANSGVCPISGERVIKQAQTVRDCLSLLYSCGMYDYSGTFAFQIGLPAKSGISGCLFVVVPGVMGMAIYSPLVDKRGNSIKGIEFCKQLTAKFNISILDCLVGSHEKISLR
ncbi:hypothetical protein ABK040_009898 [Willaertia magna]